MCVIELEPCDFFDETHRRARKSHVCDCCDGAIDPGEVYIAHASKFEGYFTFEKMCALCDLAVADFQEEHDTRSNPSYMRQLLQECIAEVEDAGRVKIDDDALRELTMLGARWKRHLDEMNERRDARRVA